MRRRRSGAAVRGLALLSLGALAIGCGADPDISSVGRAASGGAAVAVPSVVRVALRDLAFAPDRVTIPAGGTVEWVWGDGVIAHNVVGPGFHSPTQSAGSFRHRFTAPGTYEVRCLLHPSMRSSVVVR
ncbi:MAG: blue (type 1) copper domain protein [Acidimicrobiales bacterium]|nr:blue (type 1) copper domain protein [Acidimicrobiales bacterium]